MRIESVEAQLHYCPCVLEAGAADSEVASVPVAGLTLIAARRRRICCTRSDCMSRYRMASSDSLASTSDRSEEHTSELQSLMRISYAVFCLKKKKNTQNT